MANVVTRYNNGTFEAPQGTWDDQITDTHIISNDYAAQGIASCKITLPPTLTDPSQQGALLIFLGEFPVGVAGEETEARLKIRVPADMPDDMLFFIAGLGGFTTVQGITQVVRAVDCKAGFADLKANWAAGNAYPTMEFPLATSLFLYVVRNTQELFDATNIEQYYPGLTGYSNNVAWPGGKLLYIDVMEAEPKAIPVLPNIDAQFGDLLYHKENIFLISDGNEVFEANEPVGWDKILITLQLDTVMWGYMFQFTDKDITLQFDDAAGRQFLFDKYKADGCDAKAFLMFGIVDRTDPDNVIVTNLFEMQFDFSTYEEDDTFVKLNLSRRSFNDLFKNRYDTKVSLDSPRTLAGTALTPLVKPELWLHAIRVQYKARFKYNKIVNVADPIVWQISPGFSNDCLDTVPPFKSKSSNVPDLSDPIAPDGQLLYVNLSGGQLVRRLGFTCKMYLTISIDENTPSTSYSISLIFYKKNFLKGPDIPVNPPIDGEFFVQDTHNLGDFAGTFDVDFDVAGSALLNAGEALFMKVQFFNHGVPGIEGHYRNIDNWVMTFDDNSNAAPTVVETYPIYEAIERQLHIITDQPGLLKSNLLGRTDLGYDANGCASHHLTFNGKMVRGIQNFSTISAKDWFTVINTLYCAGASVERDNLGNEFLRVEEIPYFFQDVELLRLDTISNYEKECAADYIYNELSFGYAKFPQDNQDNSLDEPLNQMSYATPIEQVQNKLEVICNFILSSLYILYTQAQKFKDAQEIDVDADKPKSTFETDNENFLVSVLDAEYNGGAYVATIDATNKTITLNNWRVAIVPGDPLILYYPSAPLGVNITVRDVEILTPPVNQCVIYYDSAAPLVAGAGVAVTLQLAQSVLGPGRRIARVLVDDFSSITGIAFPETRYNMEHSIKRIFYRWSAVVAAGLTEKQATQVITFLEAKLTDTLQVNEKLDLACKANPESILTGYQDNRSEAIGNLKKPLFKSNIIKFRAPLSWNTVNLIKMAFEGRHPGGKNYGYVTITNPRGEIEKGRFRLMKYDPTKAIATFELLEKPQ